MARRLVVVGSVLAGVLAVASSAFAVDAKALYDKKCKLCHSIGGEGGKKADLGGPLDGVGAKRDEAWLREYFANPKSKIPNAKMPKMPLPKEEWDALIQLMLSLKEPAPAKK